MSRLFIALMLAVAPSWAISLTTLDISWDLSENGTSICSGSFHDAGTTINHSQTVCGGVLDGLNGFTFEAFGSSESGVSPVGVLLAAHVRGFVDGTGVFPPGVVPSFSIEVNSIFAEQFVYQGNPGDGRAIWLVGGSAGGGGGGIGTIDAAVGNNNCDPNNGLCDPFDFTFGEPFVVALHAFAAVGFTFDGGADSIVSVSAPLIVTDRSGRPLGGVLLNEVPEPATWISMLAGLAIIVCYRVVNSAANPLASVSRVNPAEFSRTK